MFSKLILKYSKNSLRKVFQSNSFKLFSSKTSDLTQTSKYINSSNNYINNSTTSEELNLQVDEEQQAVITKVAEEIVQEKVLTIEERELAVFEKQKKDLEYLLNSFKGECEFVAVEPDYVHKIHFGKADIIQEDIAPKSKQTKPPTFSEKLDYELKYHQVIKSGNINIINS